MNDLINSIEAHLERHEAKLSFDGTRFSLYSPSPFDLHSIEKAAEEVKHSYGIESDGENLSFRCDADRFKTQLIDLVIKSAGF